jgi:hypothetical protein
MRAHISLLSCAIALALFTVASVRADTLLIDRVQRESAYPLPPRGLSMAQIEARYGAPTSKLTPAGGDSQWHPTINRWVYPDYTIYFEKDRVINSVLNRASPNEIGPKNATSPR